jgi:DMSO/TMAO reductase YedYZ molybdopterin-dependent catalytic subunit
VNNPEAQEPEPSPRRTGVDVRVAGAAATAVALAALWVASGFVGPVAFPPTALAGTIIRETPGDIATFFIEVLQMWARRLLVVGALGTSLLLGAEALVRTASAGKIRPLFAGGILAVVGWLAALPGPRTYDPALTGIALVVAAVIYVAVARAVMGERREAPGGVAEDARGEDVRDVDWGRRRALKLGAGTALGIAAGGGVVGHLARRLSGPDTDVSLVRPALQAAIPERPPWPEIPGLTSEITTTSQHYVVDINLVRPAIEADAWQLRVHGQVDNPLELDFPGLQKDFEVVEEFSVLTCISNEVGGGLVGHSRWGGVRLGDVLEAAGVRSGRSHTDVLFRAADGYSDSITLETALDRSVLLAVAQNGRPLTQEHGFPCRVRVPSTYGMKNVKWIEEIEVVHDDYKGYWMQRGWSDVALVKTSSRIDVAGVDGGASAGEATWIAGVAWAGDRGVSSVEVSTDDGETWEDAMLKEPVDELSWRQWALRWTPERSGTVSVLCRAVDGRGRRQTAATADPHPDGSSGYHRRTVVVS